MKNASDDGGEQSLVLQRRSSTELTRRSDPATVEHEVSLLREECSRLLHELEERYEKARRVPHEVMSRARRLYAALVSLERAAARIVRERAVELIVGALVVGAFAALIGSQRQSRRRIRWVTRLLP